MPASQRYQIGIREPVIWHEFDDRLEFNGDGEI